jgi:hypothetical protein
MGIFVIWLAGAKIPIFDILQKVDGIHAGLILSSFLL